MFCSKCGEMLPDNAKFCTNCGEKVVRRARVIDAEPQRQAPEFDAPRYEAPNFETYQPTAMQGLTPTPSVGPIEAVISYFTKYADFSGRARRSEYWWVVLFTAILGSIWGGIFPHSEWILNLALLIPSIAVAVRRLHDVGKSGLYLLWNICPVVGSILVLIQLIRDSAPGSNAYGSNPKYPQ